MLDLEDNSNEEDSNFLNLFSKENLKDIFIICEILKNPDSE